MGWRDILKTDIEDLVQELEILFRGFPVQREMTPAEEKRLRRDARLMIGDTGIKGIKPHIQSMKFMQDFPEIERDGLHFAMSFKLYDQRVSLIMPLLNTETQTPIGNKAGDTFPIISTPSGEIISRVCIKAQGVMTNGDMMVAILLASKNNQLPSILTLPAYIQRFFPQLKGTELMGGVLYNDEEHRFKIETYRLILDKIEGLDEIEIPTMEELFRESLDWLNDKLKEYMPNKVLAGW
jgi:hypothetical protein